jgi:hypothetical protein
MHTGHAAPLVVVLTFVPQTGHVRISRSANLALSALSSLEAPESDFEVGPLLSPSSTYPSRH